MRFTPPQPPCIRTQGLTLIDLILSLAILLILITLGVPSMRLISAKSLQTTQVNNFVSHFALARSLAITREQHQILCPSTDGKTCLDRADWSKGLIIFEDTNRNGVQDLNEPLQACHHPAAPSEIEIHSSRNRKRVIYHGDGRPSGYNLTLTFCDPDERIAPKAVIVNNVGRVRVSDSRPDGSPLRCGE